MKCLGCERMVATRTGYCVNCDPDRRASMAAARRLGGVRRRRRVADVLEPVGIQCPLDLVGLLERAIRDTLLLDNSPGRSRALSTLALASLKVFEAADLEERVKLLESRLTFTPGGGR